MSYSPLKYTEPENPVKTVGLPSAAGTLEWRNQGPVLQLRYFQKPLDKNSFVDVSDGISSVADLEVSRYDGRPFSKYFNGSLTLQETSRFFGREGEPERIGRGR